MEADSRADNGTGRTAVALAYERLVADGELTRDPAQRAAVGELDALAAALVDLETTNGGLAGFFKKRRRVPDGLYLWGDVGRGKTLLMDLFFEHVDIAAKRRVHFHEFMDEMHTAIAEFRRTRGADRPDADPVAAVVKPVIRDVRLLCFDEFHVNDITNAMLLGRLFDKLFGAGLVMVATSNVRPDRLYENGLNRQLFTPFIDLLEDHCAVMELGAARDFRLEKLSSRPIFQFGPPETVKPEMDRLWQSLAGSHAGPAEVGVLGRRIAVPEAAMGAARFDFADLCDRPLGSRDYLAITHQYHTLMIDNVPRFERTGSNAAKRFILLIDTLYDRGARLAASFAAPLRELSRDPDTAFEFQRCVSRLEEMRSDAYLAGTEPAAG